ncbi:MAG: bifunctional nuclease family protein [Opitutales bacterium]|nr:bifunctional nuclease family protein [Opitutales bacterium]
MNTDWIKPTGYHFFDMADSSAIFVECPQKTFVMQTERGIGERLQQAQEGKRNPRPMTHELLFDMCVAVGAKIAGVALTDVKDGVYFSVISLEMKNELGEKFIELDARPSDALALAFAVRAPVLVSKKLIELCEDAGSILEKLRRGDPHLRA